MRMPFPATRWPVSLVTNRLLLRPIERSDVVTLSGVWTDPDVRRYLGGPVSGRALRAREQGCVGHFGAFSVVRSRDRAVLGQVSVEPRSRWEGRTEVSYQLLSAHWGRGYGREAVGAAVSWTLHDADFAQPGVVAVTQEANHRSRRLLEAVGMSVIHNFVEWEARQVVYAVDRASACVERPVVRHEDLRGTSHHGSIQMSGSDTADA
ncbi:GNAT family N-acetyltransferase [Streptomyces sp. NPDC057428]|uniref:GNAT family N-acetyltransferase n=1 Tax=Streptomyces sp. NPDC057428 TaxID=3346129 RepID=UPI0036A256C1